MNRIAFANSLRGVASLMVVVQHFIVVFGALKGEYAGFPPLPDTPFPEWLFNSVLSIPTDFGALGVAIFFLISGLVIPNSIASLSGSPLGRLGFIVNRFFRLYPTYFVALLITATVLDWAYLQNAVGFKNLDEYILINASFFRDWDWTGTSPIGGVIWTLEVEAKFYLFILIFWGPLSKGRLYPLFVIATAALLSIPFDTGYPVAWNPPQNFAWFFKYLLFMCIGIAFSMHIRKQITTEKLVRAVLGLVTIFLVVCVATKTARWVYLSYVEALALFAGLYVFAPGWTGGRFVRALADISYPLYAVHSALGYIGMRVMIGAGIDSLVALAIMVSVSVAAAWLIHHLVERPTQWMSKHGGRSVAAAGIWLRKLSYSAKPPPYKSSTYERVGAEVIGQNNPP